MLMLTKFNDTEYYKIISQRLLKNGFEIPNSIAHLFKELNANALLKIYIDLNFWNECIQIISEQVDNIVKKENIEMSTDNENDKWSSKTSSTLSYTNIDKILYVLSKSKDISEVGFSNNKLNKTGLGTEMAPFLGK